jgi:hypothetical protein
MFRTVPIDAVRPSQLYLNSAKLTAVIDWFDFDEPDYWALPVLEYNGDPYLTDGHTRAFVAYLAGVDELRVVQDDTDFDRTDRLLYHECLGWCANAGITTISDLAGRVLNPETYEEKWIDRCHHTANLISRSMNR